ncbi:hypothetical protein [Nostoc sp. FACHB-888]|uniref:hypothetical protein n=1 Tax=Nostoc sp. FACHB-888 TaxID=2692842 RepID=UPI001682A1D9|nr:hypothetical protein [Nostoc sp. FACHB-888]MBD2246053.1 hypothetical protein [Nostoc sp. FACHB-888]MCC5648303.1 hypothetical protein [Nostoc sp. XA013]
MASPAVCIAQLLTVQSQQTEILNIDTAKLDEQSIRLEQILEILRDAYGSKLRNGGSGL